MGDKPCPLSADACGWRKAEPYVQFDGSVIRPPNETALQRIEAGWSIKVSNGLEKLFVHVTGVDSQQRGITGVLANRTSGNTGYTVGDDVVVPFDCILQAFSLEERVRRQCRVMAETLGLSCEALEPKIRKACEALPRKELRDTPINALERGYTWPSVTLPQGTL